MGSKRSEARTVGLLLELQFAVILNNKIKVALTLLLIVFGIKFYIRLVLISEKQVTFLS